MECKTTSTKRRQRGATLIEMMVASAIGSLGVVALAALTFYSARSFASLGNYALLDQQSRNTLDKLTRLVRESDGVLTHSNQEMAFSYHTTNRLTISYSPQTKKLTQTISSGSLVTSETLLEDCDYFRFDIFQRNPISGSYDQYPATLDTSAAKIVQVTWVCSKDVLGVQKNTESVQSAKIVIRKQ